MNIDPEGHFFWLFFVGAIIGTIIYNVVLDSDLAKQQTNSQTLSYGPAIDYKPPITSGPAFDTEGKGWGTNGEFVVFQKIMLGIAAAATALIFIGTALFLFGGLIAEKTIALISAAVGIVAGAVGGFGGAG